MSLETSDYAGLPADRLTRAGAMTTVITTWLAGNLSKGTLHCLYMFATANDAGEVWPSGTYSTPEGARRAARRRGLTPVKGVYQGHRAALRALGHVTTETNLPMGVR